MGRRQTDRMRIAVDAVAQHPHIPLKRLATLLDASIYTAHKYRLLALAHLAAGGGSIPVPPTNYPTPVFLKLKA